MSDSQEEKIKYLFRTKGYRIEEIIDKLKISRQTLYNSIRKSPLDRNFVKKVYDILSIDLDNDLIIEETKKPDQNDRAEIDALNAEVKRLKDELLKLQSELLEFY